MHSLTLTSVAVIASIASATTVVTAAPAPVGKRALLSVTIQIDGAGQRTSRGDGTDVKWSTHRVLEAKIELVAAKPAGQSAANFKAQAAAAAAHKPSASLQALQQQAAKCKDGDTECQMAIATQMMDTPEAEELMDQADAANDASPRYQSWSPPSKAGKFEVKAEYQEKWDGVFLTASREVRNCVIALPAVLGAKDRDTLQQGFKGINVEIDTQTGKSALQLIVGAYAAGELQCRINDGGRVSNEKESKNLTFQPPIDIDATAGWVTGGAATGAAIAHGELSFATKPEAHALTGMMSVTAPLKVSVRWDLTPL